MSSNHLLREKLLFALGFKFDYELCVYHENIQHGKHGKIISLQFLTAVSSEAFIESIFSKEKWLFLDKPSRSVRSCILKILRKK